MKHNTYIYIVLILFFAFSCKEQEARRPKKHSVTNFYKEVLAQNKKLNALENNRIKEYILKDTVHNFKSSSSGFWYAYIHKDTIHKVTPQKDDLVTVQYAIKTLVDQPIYNEQEVSYKVDKQDFIPGLQEGVKLMKKGEEMIFIIPSYSAYGVTGDGNKIKINQSIKTTLKLIKIKQENNENN